MWKVRKARGRGLGERGDARGRVRDLPFAGARYVVTLDRIVGLASRGLLGACPECESRPLACARARSADSAAAAAVIEAVYDEYGFTWDEHGCQSATCGMSRPRTRRSSSPSSRAGS